MTKKLVIGACMLVVGLSADDADDSFPPECMAHLQTCMGDPVCMKFFQEMDEGFDKKACDQNAPCKAFLDCALANYKMSTEDIEEDFPVQCRAKATTCVNDAVCRPILNMALATEEMPNCGTSAECGDLLECFVLSDPDTAEACKQPYTECVRDPVCAKLAGGEEDEAACVLNDKCFETVKCELEPEEKRCLTAHRECYNDASCKGSFHAMSFVELEDVVLGGLAGARQGVRRRREVQK